MYRCHSTDHINSTQNILSTIYFLAGFNSLLLNCIQHLLTDTLLSGQLYQRLACEAGGTVLRVWEYCRRRSTIPIHQLRSYSAKTLRLQRRIPRQLRKEPTSAFSKPRYSQLPLGYNLSLYFNISVSGNLLLRTPFSRLEGVPSRELPLYSRGVIFTRARVSLALLSLRKNGGLHVVYFACEKITTAMVQYNNSHLLQKKKLFI